MLTQNHLLNEEDPPLNLSGSPIRCCRVCDRGGINVRIETARDCDIATLMWITGIDRLFQAGKFDKAKIICFDAPKIHFHELKQV